MKTGIELIADERRRQEEEEGWTAQHDDGHWAGELLAAARCYTGHALGLIYRSPRQLTVPMAWPWHATWWKPSDTPIPDLVKAGALIAAEIDRQLRADEAAKEATP